MEPKLRWQVHVERDYAYAHPSESMTLSIELAEGKWQAFATTCDRVDEASLMGMAGAQMDATDIVDAMVECERLAADALVEMSGGLVVRR